MKVLFVSSEIYPHVKIGGLGDVAEALPAALKRQGVDVRLMLPGYPEIIDNLAGVRVLPHVRGLYANSVRLLQGVIPGGMPAYVIDAPHLYNRAHPYTDEEGRDWDDNAERFSLLGHIAADIESFDAAWTPHIVHGQDWPCGLIPAYLKARDSHIKSVLTIHNMAYQGLFPRAAFDDLELPAHFYATEGVEFHDKVGFLKAGLHFADAITAVSPTYAAEIQQHEKGCGLEGLMQRRRDALTGILNGINTDIWDPETDPHIAACYSPRSLRRKKKNRQALLAEFGLEIHRQNMVLGVIGRLAKQKGFDLLRPGLERFLQDGGGLVVLGKGERDIEEDMRALAKCWPQQVGFHAGYDEAMAHRIVAGADALVVPSRFEPCGLVQMYAMRYGTLPIVHHTGGLADTVSEAEGTGFVFERADAASLARAVARTRAAFAHERHWRRLQRRAMEKDFSWSQAASQYAGLYENLLRNAA